MRSRSPPLPITLELGPALDRLGPLIQAKAGSALEGRLQDLLEEMGLPGVVRFEVTNSASLRAVRVRVSQHLVPFPPLLMQRVWMISVPPHLRTAFLARHPQNGFPDAWLAEHWQGLRDSEADGASAVCEFLKRLIVEVIRYNPEVLVDPLRARHYAKLANATKLVDSIGVESFAAILADLLRLGLSLRRRSRVIGAIGEANRQALTPAEIVESVFDRLRPSVIEFRAHPDFISGLVNSVSPLELATMLSGLDDTVFARFGINLPRISLTGTRWLEPGLVSVKLNDRVAVPVQGVPVDSVLTEDDPGEMSPSVPRVPILHPATDDVAWVVPAGSAQVSMAPIEFASRLLEHEIASRLSWLLSSSDVEYQLALLATAYPELVRLSLSRITIEELTRVLRGLLSERVAIPDLRGILQCLMEFNDDAATADRVREARRAVVAQCWERWLLGPDGLSVVQATVPAPDSLLAEATAEVARDAFFAVTPSRADLLPVVVSADARPPLRQILAPELPDLPVLAHDEIPSHIKLRVVERVNVVL